MPPYASALVYLGLGEKDKAFEWLNKAFVAGDVHLILSACRSQVGRVQVRLPVCRLTRQVWLSGQPLMLKALRRLAAVAWLLTLVTTVAWAQPAARLSGVVRDETGGALSGVNITIRGACVPTQRTVITDEHAQYQVPPVVPRPL